MPMVDAGLTKAEIRALSQGARAATWDKPQLACLSSRFPYGTKITPERLRRSTTSRTACARSASASSACASTTRSPASRSTPTSIARVVEVRERIVALGKKLGFTYVALDLAGFRSGSMNEVAGPSQEGASESASCPLLALASVAHADSKKDRELAAKAICKVAAPAAGTKPAPLDQPLQRAHARVDGGRSRRAAPRGRARPVPARPLHQPVDDDGAASWSACSSLRRQATSRATSSTSSPGFATPSTT